MKQKTIRGVSSAILFIALLYACCHTATAQTQPFNYWTCDTASDNGTIRDMKGNFNLQFPNQTFAVVTGGHVGKYLSLDKAARLINGSGSIGPLTSSFSIEMLWKPGRDFGSTQFWSIGNKANCKLSIRQTGNGVPCFQFKVADSTFTIFLDKNGKQEIGYYLNKWTHLVWTYNDSTGVMKMYVDGESPTTFSKTIPAHSFPAGNAQLTLNSVTEYRKIYGYVDEIAIYNSAISAGQVTSNWYDTEIHHHYRFVSATPSPSSITAGVYNSEEYAPGSVLLDTGHTTGVTLSALQQLNLFPSPRYREGNKLLPLFNFIDLQYAGGLEQIGVTDPMWIDSAFKMNVILNKKFNYYFMISNNLSSRTGNYKDTTKFEGKNVKHANANPSLKLQGFIFQAQLQPNKAGFTSTTPYIEKKTLPNIYYLMNNSGEFLHKNGTAPSAIKYISPECPTDSLQLDGKTARWALDTIYKSLNRPLNYIVENDEVLVLYSASTLMLDPRVNAARNASGLSWSDYIGRYKYRLTAQYLDTMLKKWPTTLRSVYQVGGYDAIWPAWKEIRALNSKINGQFYSALDLYPRGPDNWETVTSADRGNLAATEAMVNELAAGDKLKAYWISPGWSATETKSVRPAQWLGLLKCWSVFGSEYFHVGFFNLPFDTCKNFNSPCKPPPFSKNYAWQWAMPAYAQAVTSYAEDVLRLGDLMPGDRIASIDDPKPTPGYRFTTGDPRVLCVVRKKGSKYWIASSMNVWDNKQFDQPGGVATTIYLDGDTLTFESRKQGSVYIYDKTNPSAKLFYQLDAWHEPLHPYYWSKEIKMQAEVCDSMFAGVTMVTEQAEDAVRGDYMYSTTYLKTQPNSKINYSVAITQSKTQYAFIRARNKGAYGTIQLTMNGKSFTSDRINTTNWKWYRIKLGPLNVNAADKLQLIVKRSNIDIDEIEITDFQFAH